MLKGASKIVVVDKKRSAAFDLDIIRV